MAVCSLFPVLEDGSFSRNCEPVSARVQKQRRLQPVTVTSYNNRMKKTKSSSSRRKVKLKQKSVHFVSLKIRNSCVSSRSIHRLTNSIKCGDPQWGRSFKFFRKNRRKSGTLLMSKEGDIPNVTQQEPSSSSLLPLLLPRPGNSQLKRKDCPDSEHSGVKQNGTRGCERAENPSWSPFFYEQMGLFDDNYLRNELSSIFPDWLQEFTIDPSFDGIPSCWDTNNYCRRKDPFVSFARGDTTPDPVTYCQIFGAQNCFDSYPEYSPFNEDSLSIIESLVVKHHSSYVGAEASTFEDRSISIHRNLGSSVNETETRSYRSPLRNNDNNYYNKGPPVVKNHHLDGYNDADPFSQDQDYDLVPKVVRCQVCHIFRSMQKKHAKFSHKHIAAECTNCGRIVGSSGP